MRRKTVRGGFTLKQEKGAFRAIFSRFNVVDADNDVTLPGAFEEGAPVRISYWGHRWNDLPVGRGTIHSDSQKAWVDGHFFMETEGGRETYNVVKGLAELQEWSYGFNVLDSEPGKHRGAPVRFLRRVEVHEVSPVLKAAGVNTVTEYVKGHTPTRAALMRQIDELDPGKARGTRELLREIDAQLAEHSARETERLFKQMAELEARVKELAPTTRIEAYQQELIADGMSPALAAAWAESAIASHEAPLLAMYPMFERASPGWARRQALRHWQSPIE